MIGADTTFLVELEVIEHPNHAAARETLRQHVLDAGQPLVLAGVRRIATSNVADFAVFGVFEFLPPTPPSASVTNA